MELREKIALTIVKEGLRYEWAAECADKILALIKDAGYVKLEDIPKITLSIGDKRE